MYIGLILWGHFHGSKQNPNLSGCFTWQSYALMVNESGQSSQTISSNYYSNYSFVFPSSVNYLKVQCMKLRGCELQTKSELNPENLKLLQSFFHTHQSIIMVQVNHPINKSIKAKCIERADVFSFWSLYFLGAVLSLHKLQCGLAFKSSLESQALWDPLYVWMPLLPCVWLLLWPMPTKMDYLSLSWWAGEMYLGWDEDGCSC